MSWDRKAGGHPGGYYYESRRVPDKPHPVKLYCGRKDAGREAADRVERRKRERAAARDAARAEAAATAEADRLAADLAGWARLLERAWLAANGFHEHKGTWRRRRAQE